MVVSALPLPAVLVVGHPGHELRLFHRLERARPAGTLVERYGYAVTTSASGAGIVLDLDAADVERKALTAAFGYGVIAGTKQAAIS